MMEYKKLVPGDVAAAKQIWTDAFGDSAAFVDFYFSHKFQLENSMGAFDDGILVGDITMQVFGVKLRNAFIKTGFLAGCATNAEYRNQGIMKNLLLAQLKEMNRNGYSVCHLHPFKHLFYRKFGWETVSYMYKFIKKFDKIEFCCKENEFDYDNVYRLYNAFAVNADGYFIRTFEEMQTRILEHLNDGGKIISTTNGYALYFILGNIVDVIEFAAMNEPDFMEIISGLARYEKEIHCYVPDYLDWKSLGVLEEYTMMRIVNAKRLLSQIVFLNGCFTLSVQDDFCEWNNGTYLIESNDGKTLVKDYAGEGELKANISQFCQYAAGKIPNDGSGLAQLFSGQKTCFFNTY